MYIREMPNQEKKKEQESCENKKYESNHSQQPNVQSIKEERL
jgi:hypothetical protein